MGDRTCGENNDDPRLVLVAQMMEHCWTAQSSEVSLLPLVGSPPFNTAVNMSLYIWPRIKHPCQANLITLARDADCLWRASRTRNKQREIIEHKIIERTFGCEVVTESFGLVAIWLRNRLRSSLDKKT